VEGATLITFLLINQFEHSMSLSDILNEISGVSEGDLPDISLKTPVKEVGIPQQKGNYAESFYRVLSEIEENTVYHRDTYSGIVSLNTKFSGQSYSPALAIGPAESDASITKLYIIGKESDPIDFIGAIAEQVYQNAGDADALAFPVVDTVADAESLDLDFGEAVAVKSTQDIYFETSVSN
jgi:hypothetical protein